MPEANTQNPSVPPENDWSKEIEIAEDIRKRALDQYKITSIDRLNIQQSVIRNYLWLAITVLAAEFAFFWRVFERSQSISDLCPIVILGLSVCSAMVALVIGIRAMTGTTFNDPDDNYVEMFSYLTSQGYDQGNHYALLEEEVKRIKAATEEALDQVHIRGLSMRRMNVLLVFSTCSGAFSAFLYFLPTLF